MKKTDQKGKILTRGKYVHFKKSAQSRSPPLHTSPPDYLPKIPAE